MTETQPALAERLATRFGDKLARVQSALGEITIEVAAEHLLEVARALRDERELRFEQLIDLCGVDYLSFGQDEWETTRVSNGGFSRGVEGEGAGRFAWSAAVTPAMPRRYAVVVHLLSLANNQRLRLRVFASDEALPSVPSLVETWISATWFEREAFDLFGIIFEGHEDLRRILTDYGFIGHPMRKDFPVTGHVEMRYDAQSRRVVYQPVSIEVRENTPRVVREDNYGGLH